MTKLADQLKAARRVSVPLVAINTPDPAATVELLRMCAGDAPLVQWDLANGLAPVNDAAVAAIASLNLSGQGDQDLRFTPVPCLLAAGKLPKGTMLVMHLAHKFVCEPLVLQAIWNLRDAFKVNFRMLVLLGTNFVLPAELAGDVVLFDEPLPDRVQLSKIVRQEFDNGGIKKIPEQTLDQAVDALSGLSAFAAEQITAMSLSPKTGLDVDALWERKRQQIEQTPGLRVYRGGETFSEIGGVDVVKRFLTKIVQGQSKPNAVVFVDEIEKMLAGSRGDMSGVTQDQLGSLLSYMQDRQAAGMIFVGPPGSAKSMVAKAAGNSAGVPTIQLDLGAAKGSLVGQSEQQLRVALKVITAVSNSSSLWIATCNSIGELPPELRRRFTLGTFFFDLPSRVEREKIWGLWMAKHGLRLAPLEFSDEGWTGAEIRQCCEIAWRLGCPLAEAAGFIVPVARSAADQIERLRQLASGRFLSASYPGVYDPKKRERDAAAEEFDQRCGKNGSGGVGASRKRAVAAD